MQVHHSTEHLPAFRNSVITIGTFDGVHLGHQKIIAALKQEARRFGGETIIITFHPHPRRVVHPGEPLQLINTQKEKIELLGKAAIDHLVIVPFTPAFSEISADEYVASFLVNKFQPTSIIIGYDHKFGKGRVGDYKLLEQKAAQFNYQLIEISQHLLNEIAVSSTKIRKAVLESDIEAANSLLGYSFFFEGEVISGDQLGRTIGFPTANLRYTDSDKIHLGHGVYAVSAEVDGKTYKGMMSIGTRPTLNKTEEKVEVNLFDFDEMIYSKTLRVTVKAFLRKQEKYPSLEDMVQQLHHDKENSLAVL